jgi:DNA-binding transcriptional LysR family regulator
VKEFVEMGMGASIMSEYYLYRENRRDLIVKDVSTHFGFSETGLLVRKGRYLNHAARSFMALVFKEMRKKSYFINSSLHKLKQPTIDL